MVDVGQSTATDNAGDSWGPEEKESPLTCTVYSIRTV